jgi:hypothetical protein
MSPGIPKIAKQGFITARRDDITDHSIADSKILIIDDGYLW